MTDNTIAKITNFTALVLLSLCVCANASPERCNPASFLCVGHDQVSRCIPKGWLCDGFSDCHDNMDEKECFYKEVNCTGTDNPIQCGAFNCLAKKDAATCNGKIDCRGYNGTYVKAAYGSDEDLDFCRSGTTTVKEVYAHHMGWQPPRYKDKDKVKLADREYATITAPPFTKLTTTDSFWRNYCTRQIAINYCPRRCAINGMCWPVRINPPRYELVKMRGKMNPPVVTPQHGRVTRTTVATSTTTQITTTEDPEYQGGRRNLLEFFNPENLVHNPGPDSSFDFGNNQKKNSLDATNKKRRESKFDPSLTDGNAIYDWSDGLDTRRKGGASSVESLPSMCLLTIVTFFLK